jgi:protein-tyrosine phosphatase
MTETQSLSQPATLFQKVAKGLRIIAGRLREQGPRTTVLWFTERTYRILTGISPIRTSRVLPNLYVGGQHKRRGLPAMAQRGITACVDLRREYGDVEHGLDLEQQLSLPTDDDNAPTLSELAEAVEFIREALAEGRGVYVHCANGVGRAPTTVAAYLITTGLTPKEAWAKIRQVRPFIRPTKVQRDQLERFAQQRKQTTKP